MKLLDISEVQAMQLELMKKLHTFLESNSIRYYLIAGSALGAVRHRGFIPWDDDIDVGMLREDYEKFLSLANLFCSDYEIVNYKNAKNCDFSLTRIYFSNTYIENSSILKTKLDKRLYFDIFPLDNVPDDNATLKKYEKRIINKKKLILYMDVRDYGDSKIKLAFKKAISMVLSPLRNKILRSFDKLQKKYELCNTARVCSLSSQYSFKKQVMEKEVYGTPTLYKFEDAEFFLPEQTEKYLTTLYGKNYMEIPPVEKRRKGHNIYLTCED